jgi:hypothetical protein
LPERGTVVVSGPIAGHQQGGLAWLVLQYVLGFRRLGLDVYLVEPVDELTPPVVAYFREVTAAFALEDRAALVVKGSRETAGLAYDELPHDADVLLNFAGVLEHEELTGRVAARVYLDLDPAFTQLWQDVEGIDMRFDDHTHFVTVGLGLGSPDCVIPTCGREWLTTVPPVVLGQWPVADGLACDALTTVANWRGYGSIEHDGVFYGQKAHSLRQLIEMPRLTDEKVVLALAIHEDETRDLEALAANGWELLDPLEVAGTPAAYRGFVQGSKAELGIAKSGYVESGCGWFSDRSVCYLASGRPVVAQETGFSKFVPTGEGLFAFETVDDAIEAIEELRGDYERHRRAARALAEDVFDSDKVLSRLLACL